ncbi:M23 family metallopeptidase [Paenibacillus rhizovicinus]|uniref:M23 family metallopeptidase n=1 Tax=Paenibacillus rhizovicinus TaxID=2704463 RepID=A0A6C0P6M4_9BACL|nr:M23 family metallopeptidase [Paenibacillus rhizovicinus]QHW34177.1 M23 family metallopeptidase [Paenibacillus rhizovicinus]
MDTRNSIRERRQERIRRIIEHNAKQTAHAEQRAQQYEQHQQHQQQPRLSMQQQAPQHHQQQQPHQPEQQGLLLPASARDPRESKQGQFVQPAVQREEDPERLWKANPNPWQTAGWNIAPLPSKDVRASKQGGPPPDPPKNDARFIVRGLFIQSVIAAAVFAIVYLMFNVQQPAAKKGQEAVTAALTENMDFHAASSLYQKWFAGAPSFIPFFGAKGDEESRFAEGSVTLPIVSPLPEGSVVQTFAETLSGVEIAGTPDQTVLAAETGRVTLVTEDSEDGATVVVQHANERVTIYSHLFNVIVAANDWVEAGKTLGKLASAKADENGQSLLFFAVKEKGRYVDPADVVPID